MRQVVKGEPERESRVIKIRRMTACNQMRAAQGEIPSFVYLATKTTLPGLFRWAVESRQIGFRREMTREEATKSSDA